MADNKEFYRLDLIIGTDGVEGTEKQLKALEKLLQQTERRAAALGKTRINPTASLHDRVTGKAKDVTTTMSRLDRAKAEPTATLRDRVSGAAERIGSSLRTLSRTPFNVVIGARDMATGVIRKVTNALTSPLAMIGVGGGVAGVTKVGLDMVMDEQSITSAFKVLLGGEEAAKKRVDDLVKFAGQTPYTRMEIFKSSRILEVFTKGKLSEGDGLRMVGDIAAGTQTEFENVALWMGRLYDGMAAGRKVGEATSRLQEMGAIDGAARDRLEYLAEAPGDIAKRWETAMKEFGRFDGMMEDMSGNLANLFLGARSFFTQNIIKRWGQGVESVIGPMLQRFREWRGENKELIASMAASTQEYGRRVTQFVVGGLENIIGKVREVASTDAFQNASLFGKAKILWDEIITQPLEDWWAAGGEQKLTRFSDKMGDALGGGLHGFIMGALGVVDGEAATGEESVYIEAGRTAGKAFFDSFIEALDPAAIVNRIGDVLVNVNKQAIEDPSVGNVTKAIGVTAVAAAGGAWILKRFKPLTDLLKGAGKAGAGVYRGAKGLFGGTKPPMATTVPTTSTTTKTKPVNPSTDRPKVRAKHPYEKGFNPRYDYRPDKTTTPPRTTTSPAKPGAFPSWLGKTAKTVGRVAGPVTGAVVLSDMMSAIVGFSNQLKQDREERGKRFEETYKNDPRMLAWGALPFHERMTAASGKAAKATETKEQSMFGTGSTPVVKIPDDQIAALTGYLQNMKLENNNQITVSIPTGAVQVTVQKEEINWSPIVNQVASQMVAGLRRSYENR